MTQSCEKKRTTFYMDSAVHSAFKKICDREGESMSEKHESFEARYVAVHMKGNPQLRLEPFFGDVQKKCFRCEGLFPHLQKIECISGLIVDVCPPCLLAYKKQTVFKREIFEV